MKWLVAVPAALLVLVCFTVIAASAAYTLNNVIEARRDLERKELTEKTIAAMEKIGREVSEKMPDLKLFNREKPTHGSYSHSHSRVVRHFGR